MVAHPAQRLSGGPTPYPWVIDEVIFESGGIEGELGMLTGS